MVPTPSRAAELERLLAQPGPLWGDPADVIVHRPTHAGGSRMSFDLDTKPAL